MSRPFSILAVCFVLGFLLVTVSVPSATAEAPNDSALLSYSRQEIERPTEATLARVRKHPVGLRPCRSAERIRRAQQLAETGVRFDLEGEPKYAKFTWLAALRFDPDCSLARSRLGYVLQDNQWVSVERESSGADAHSASTNYRLIRPGKLDRAERELWLGSWCQAQSLDDLAAVHLRRVATNSEAEPAAQREAARRLDLQPFAGQLMTRHEIRELQNTLQNAQREFHEWSAELGQWIGRLQSSRPTQRAEAMAALRQIDDPAAIPAIERLLSIRDDQLASEAVGIIANIDHIDATESLVRHAVVSPWPNVRREATIQLEKRPLHEFVPLLLDAFQSPIRSVFQITPGPAGQILHEHLLFQEGKRENRQLELTSLAIPIRRQPNAQIGRRVEQQNVVNQVQRIEQGVATWNILANQQNSRIYEVLQQTTRQQLDCTPTAWWDWWSEYNEYEPVRSKPTRRWTNYYAYRYVPTPPGSECFPAGTLVWTELGLVAIEQIEVGDRVLSQDPTTGQLSYKPVAGVTRRAEAPMQHVQVGETRFKLTTGHPVWVNGRGWRMAKFLRLGDQIHTMQGAQTVNGLNVASPDTAFNLIVADFATYFVTDQGILVHDNNERSPTRVESPGLQLAASSRSH